MTSEQKKIKAYVNAIERELKVNLEMKARINSDLGTEIHLLLEQGKTADEVIQEIGTPEEVAERFNEELKEYVIEKKSPFAWLFLIFAGLFAVSGVWEIVMYLIHSGQSISVIGGADGPASVFVAGKTGAPWISAASCLSLCMACYAAYILVRYRRYMSREKNKQAIFWSAAAFVISVTAFWINAYTGYAHNGILQWTLILGRFSGRGSEITIDPAEVLSLIVLIVSIRKYKKNASGAR